MSKKEVIRKGGLRAHIGKIGNFLAIIAYSREPFKMAYFNTRAIEAYKTLCIVFGEEKHNVMPSVLCR